MKVRCAKKDISGIVTALCRIIPARAPIPILEGFLCCAEKDRLTFQATDLELGLAMTTQARVKKEGKVVVLARYFTDLIRRLPDGDVILTWDESAQLLKAFYDHSSFCLNTWPHADYPPLPKLAKNSEEKLVIPGDIWKNAIKKMLFAAAPKEVRPNFAGVHLQLKDEVLILAATDTYRLSVFTIPESTFEQAGRIEGGERKSLFVPSRVLEETNKLLKLDEQLEVSWDKNLISFQTPRFTLTSRLLENQFPAYEKVIPGKPKLEVKIKRASFLSSLERASLFAAPPNRGAISVIEVKNDRLCLSVCTAQVGSLSEIIPIEVTGEKLKQKDESLQDKISFNTRFLLEPLRVIDSEEVILGLNGLDEPAVYREEGVGSYLHLVLPVRQVS